ncbi:Phophatidylserine decarboxylase-domain-containing protein [Hypoxylon argillaceum]|nr:Phophatidylserine decarboxylase-domain-containing protein [Hypoxylon argillaceum]KAI1149120.1 Phophatidylserine decarboxylase-domain-containing protein [Nemania diffusa]
MTIIPYRQGHFNRIGGWLPADPNDHIEFTRKLVAELKERRQFREALGADDDDDELHESVQEFDRVVKSNARFRMLAGAMLDEVPNKEPYIHDPVGKATIREYEHLLEVFDYIVRNKAPQWSMSEYKGGLIGFPFNAVLDWPMATPSGYAFFLEPQINEKLKGILNAWRMELLSTGNSLYVITTERHGWLSKEALKAIEDDTNLEGQNLTFTELFICDPIKDPAHWDFKSWDDFFVRRFKNMDTLRPVQFREDTKWIVNSCESKPFSRQTNVKEYDSFWLKGQPYSVAEMLNYEPQYTSAFVGGTVYQAFLSATSYHRWSSPVKGEVLYATVIDGTYFSEPTITGFSSPEGPDVAGPDLAQGYICHVATRAVFVIDTKDPVVGLVGAVYVGMADVSTCEIAAKFQGDLPVAVNKGEEIGMFHHGGSTHCLLFEKKVKLAWVSESSPETATRNLPIRSALAYAYDST